ncbi:MAG: hypothetical protein P8L18_15105 [Verrucomicrobiota bacterium]|nr:hypothetical protein [Verrucomicrobiota bacterium]
MKDRLGLSSLRLDGFSYIEAHKNTRHDITRQIPIKGSQREIHSDAAQGSLQIQILRETPLKSSPVSSGLSFQGEDQDRCFKSECNDVHQVA